MCLGPLFFLWSINPPGSSWSVSISKCHWRESPVFTVENFATVRRWWDCWVLLLLYGPTKMYTLHLAAIRGVRYFYLEVRNRTKLFSALWKFFAVPPARVVSFSCYLLQILYWSFITCLWRFRAVYFELCCKCSGAREQQEYGWGVMLMGTFLVSTLLGVLQSY